MIQRYNIIIKATKIGLIVLLTLCIFIIGFGSINSKIPVATANNVLLATPNLIDKAEARAGRPIFTGSGKNPYKISAEKISKNIDGLYHMNKISGVYSLENNQNVTIAANLGSINNYEDQIILNNEVRVGYEDYVLLSEKIDFDLRTKAAESDRFVQIIGSNGSISANRFNTTEEFNQITFNGNVKADFSISDNN